MKYLKKFNSFSEALEVKTTDSTDVKFSKEKMNSTEQWLKEYNQKKSTIDQVYKTEKNPEAREQKLKNLLGKSEASQGQDRNPFLVKYCRIAKSQSDVDDINKKIINDKLQLKDFEDSLGTSKDADQKKLLQSTIADCKNRISTNNQKIKDMLADVLKLEQEIKSDMDEMKKDIDKFSKEIQSQEKK
jgi:hypothetical protein